jgi:hypothetical protein
MAESGVGGTEEHMTESNAAPTVPQLDFLGRLAQAEYGQLFVRGADFRMVGRLVKAGLVEPVGYGQRWYGITDAGREAVSRG